MNPTPLTARLPLIVSIGLTLWAIPTIAFFGIVAFIPYLFATLPILAVHLIQTRKLTTISWRDSDKNHFLVLCALVIIYFTIDSIFGRQKFEYNLFLNNQAVQVFVETAKNSEGQSRGAWDLIGAIMMFLPFALIDFARNRGQLLKFVAFALAALLIIYDTGISRGFLLIALMSLLMQSGISPHRLVAGVAIAFGAFFLSSWVRGDFDSAGESNPFFEGLAWPVINFNILAESGCLKGTTDQFAIEFLKKFLPPGIVDKQIFTFNIEATKCIYPHFGNDIESISVFTYMGEFFYYQPPWLTGLLAGVILSGLVWIASSDLRRMRLTSTATFAGFMCVVLLRSRVQDVYSMLITFIIFLKLMTLFASRTRSQSQSVAS
jgi:hypothetical protein